MAKINTDNLRVGCIKLLNLRRKDAENQESNMLSFLLILLLVTGSDCICGGSWTERKREAQCEIRWRGSCGLRRKLRAIPVVDKNLVEVLNDNSTFRSDKDFIAHLKRLRQDKFNFLRKYCIEILMLTKNSTDFGINKVCRQNIPEK